MFRMPFRKWNLRSSTLATLAIATVAAVAYMGCSEEQVSGPGDGTAADAAIHSEIAGGDAGNMVIAVPAPTPVIIQPVPRLDLRITAYTTNVVPTTTGCGGVLPNVSCAGGQRFFTSTVTIQNTGPSTLPAGAQLEILWRDLTTGSSQLQVPTHPAIPPGGSITVSRPYYMGPCDCAPPFTYFLHQFDAIVDPNNLIPETNNGNNTSPTYTACDGC